MPKCVFLQLVMGYVISVVIDYLNTFKNRVQNQCQNSRLFFHISVNERCFFYISSALSEDTNSSIYSLFVFHPFGFQAVNLSASISIRLEPNC